MVILLSISFSGTKFCVFINISINCSRGTSIESANSPVCADHSQIKSLSEEFVGHIIVCGAKIGRGLKHAQGEAANL